MIEALSKTFADLGLPVVRNTLIQVVLWSIAVFLALAVLAFWGAGSADLGAWVESQSAGLPDWLSWIVDALVLLLTGAGLVLLLIFGFVVVAQNVAAFYLDKVIGAVEQARYPAAGKAPGSSIASDLGAMLRFTAVLVLLNIVALPFYFIPLVNLVVFYTLNGYLFGREYGETVAFRRMKRPEVAVWRSRHRGTLWIAGALIALAMSIPVLNVAAPVVAAVFMTHIFHGKAGSRG